MRENCGGSRAIADCVRSLLGGLPDHLDPEILDGALQFHLRGDGDAIVAHQRAPEVLIDQNALGFGTQCPPESIRQRTGAAQNLRPRLGTEQYLFVWHHTPPLELHRGTNLTKWAGREAMNKYQPSTLR
jgi:hypothetical protein